jgi:hypothetical protein
MLNVIANDRVISNEANVNGAVVSRRWPKIDRTGLDDRVVGSGGDIKAARLAADGGGLSSSAA